jgi:hypothetical protein
MSGHTGGQPGSRMLRGRCPVCGKNMPGGRVVDKPGYWVTLRYHGPRKARCTGSRAVVAMAS